MSRPFLVLFVLANIKCYEMQFLKLCHGKSFSLKLCVVVLSQCLLVKFSLMCYINVVYEEGLCDLCGLQRVITCSVTSTCSLTKVCR